MASSKRKAAETASKQRAIQRQQDAKDGKSSKARKSKTPPTDRPRPPMPAQHLSKPGHEGEMELKPQFLARNYIGSKKLKGKKAIVTGGDSGIGRAVAVLFAREGADVAIVYLDEEKDAKETRRRIEAEGSKCLLIAGDVKDRGFCKKAVQSALKKFGTIDVLVNNAAFQEHADIFTDITEERFDQTLKTNIYGYFHMAQEVVPHMKPGSAIVNTGSVTGLKGNGQLIDYSTTKGAIHAFTMSLAQNLLPSGIRVNAVAPGPVWTPLNPADKSRKDIVDFGKQTSMKRPAQPDEISPAYVFLASDICSSYITGIVLPITGSVGE